LQIIEAVMEEGEGEGLERVNVLDEVEIKKKTGPVPTPPTLPGATVPLPINQANNGTQPSSQPPPLITQESSSSEEE